MREKVENWLQAKRYNWKNYDFSLIVIVILLCTISVYTLSLVSPRECKHQLFGVVLGFILLLLCSMIDYHTLCNYVPILYVVATLMAAATKFSPLGTSGTTDSYRWLDFKIFTFQPSELCKIVLIMALAVFFTKQLENLQSYKTLFLAVAITIPPTAFILVQSDLSSSLVLICILIMMVFASGIGWRILGPVIAVIVPVSAAFIWYILQPGDKLFLQDYQIKRITGFLNPEANALGTMYQQNNSILAIASGKIYGKLLGEGVGTPRGYTKVDVRESDFIWSMLGEEYGFLGCLAILALFSVLIIKCFLAAKRAKDFTGMMIAIGISSLFCFQIFFNIGVATRILPNTGLPLPFLSSGLSSMMSSMMAVGIIINIGIQPARGNSGGFTVKTNDRNVF